MKPSLDQLCEQFGRLVAPTPSAARPAAEAAAAPVAGPASESSAGLRPADQAAKMAALPPQPPPAAPAGPIQRTDYAAKGYHFDATVAPPQVVVAAEIFDKNGFGLDAVTGVDWIAQQEMEIVYDYFHPEANLRAVVRTRVPRASNRSCLPVSTAGGPVSGAPTGLLRMVLPSKLPSGVTPNQSVTASVTRGALSAGSMSGPTPVPSETAVAIC